MSTILLYDACIYVYEYREYNMDIDYGRQNYRDNRKLLTALKFILHDFKALY